jgi:hypothetical protein
MAKRLEIVEGTGGVEITVDVASGTTASITPGCPVVRSTTTDYGKLAEDDDPTAATGHNLIGIATSTSTETTTAAGTVRVMTVIPGKTVIRGKATTPANIDTAAKLLTYKWNAVTFTLSSGDWTIDEDLADDPDVHGLVIIDGNYEEGTLDVIVKDYATIFGCSY